MTPAYLGGDGGFGSSAFAAWSTPGGRMSACSRSGKIGGRDDGRARAPAEKRSAPEPSSTGKFPPRDPAPVSERWRRRETASAYRFRAVDGFGLRSRSRYRAPGRGTDY